MRGSSLLEFQKPEIPSGRESPQSGEHCVQVSFHCLPVTGEILRVSQRQHRSKSDHGIGRNEREALARSVGKFSYLAPWRRVGRFVVFRNVSGPDNFQIALMDAHAYCSAISAEKSPPVVRIPILRRILLYVKLSDAPR